MTMNSLHCFLFLLAVAAAASLEAQVKHEATPENEKIKERTIVHEVKLNDAFDKALPSIRKIIMKKGMDPMEIPDVEIPLSHLPGLLKTKMILHKGHVQQLSTIRRTGDIIMQYNEKKISLYLNIGWEMLDLSHEYSFRYMLISRRGDCYGRYKDVKASMLVEYEFEKKKINLMFFKFNGVGNFDLKLEGHLIDGLLNVILKAVTKVFRTEVLLLIEKQAYEEIDKQVQEINDLIPSPIDYKYTVKDAFDEYVVAAASA